LKVVSDGDAMTSGGRPFQTRAGETLKARSPTVTRRVVGMFSSSLFALLNVFIVRRRLPYSSIE